MEKNKFLLFLFAMMPGVSHMYLGMLKKGIFLMSLFLSPFALIFLTRGGLEIISCMLPVIWCYSFFDTFRYKSCTKEEREDIDTEFYQKLKTFWQQDAGPIFWKRRKLVGLFCIFLAVYTFIYNIIGYFTELFGPTYWFFYAILNKVPTLLVVIFLLKLGIDLLQSEDEDFISYPKHKTHKTPKKEAKPQKPQYEVNIENSNIDTNRDTKEVFSENLEETPLEKNTENFSKEELKNEEYQKINLEKGEKVVEPIFLERRIEE